MRVIYARRVRWEDRRQLLVRGIAELDPDIILFQEEVWTTSHDQTADLVGPGRHVVHSQARSRDERSGISVASRWPVVAVHEINLTIGGPPVDEYVWATLIIEVDAPPPGGRLIIANHFPDATADREYDRERQAVLVARRLSELADPGDVPVVLAGDLDAEPDAASLRFFTGRQSVDGVSSAYVQAWDVAHPGERCWTLDPPKPAARSPAGRTGRSTMSWSAAVDPVRRRWRSTACDLVHSEPHQGVWASDHFGLVADLTIPEPSPV